MILQRSHSRRSKWPPWPGQCPEDSRMSFTWMAGSLEDSFFGHSTQQVGPLSFLSVLQKSFALSLVSVRTLLNASHTSPYLFSWKIWRPSAPLLPLWAAWCWLSPCAPQAQSRGCKATVLLCKLYPEAIGKILNLTKQNNSLSWPHVKFSVTFA